MGVTHTQQTCSRNLLQIEHGSIRCNFGQVQVSATSFLSVCHPHNCNLARYAVLHFIFNEHSNTIGTVMINVSSSLQDKLCIKTVKFLICYLPHLCFYINRMPKLSYPILVILVDILTLMFYCIHCSARVALGAVVE